MWNYLKETDKPILLYGTGNAAEKIMDLLSQRSIEFKGIFASDGFVRGQSFHGYKVMSYSEAKEKYGDMIVLLCFGSHLPSVIENIVSIASEQELYAPDLPVVGEGLFDMDYYDAHRQHLLSVATLLADDRSRSVFENVIAYRLSGRIEHLFACETPEEESWRLPGLSAGDSYLDLGAYTGDTVESFISVCPKHGRIYAVEPEERNFRKLAENTASIENISLINAAIGDCDTMIPFTHGVGRGGALGKGKVRMAQQRSVDSLLGGEPVSFIKMDVEGQEAAAVRGAEKTIRSCRPRMMVAAYHRVDDLWSLPLQILSINPDYRLYLRHSPCLPAWEVNYIFV